MRGLRHSLIHLALMALILRAFVPTGWMPNAHSPQDSTFVVCTMDGPVQVADGKALPGKDDPRAHETCSFAGAAPLAPPPQSAAFAVSQDYQRLARPDPVSDYIPVLASFSRPSSRAPPFLI